MDDLVFYREAFLQPVSTLDKVAINFSTPNVDDLTLDDLTLTISTPTLSDTRFREAWGKKDGRRHGVKAQGDMDDMGERWMKGETGMERGKRREG